MTFPVILSYFGAASVLIAFALVSYKKIEPAKLEYQFLNLAGASMLGYSSFTTHSYAFVILNGVWVIVALISIFRIFLSANKKV